MLTKHGIEGYTYDGEKKAVLWSNMRNVDVFDAEPPSPCVNMWEYDRGFTAGYGCGVINACCFIPLAQAEIPGFKGLKIQSDTYFQVQRHGKNSGFHPDVTIDLRALVIPEDFDLYKTINEYREKPPEVTTKNPGGK